MDVQKIRYDSDISRAAPAWMRMRAALSMLGFGNWKSRG